MLQALLRALPPPPRLERGAAVSRALRQALPVELGGVPGRGGGCRWAAPGYVLARLDSPLAAELDAEDRRQKAALVQLRHSAALSDGGLREAERAAGLLEDHTLRACTSSVTKRTPGAARGARLQLLLGALPTGVLGALLAAVAAGSEGAPDLAAWAAALKRARSEALGADLPLARHALPSPALPAREWGLDLRVVAALVSGADHRGSDVRLTDGALHDTRGWPRQALDPSIWHWKLAVRMTWQHEGHITALEARAYLAALRWRARCVGRHGARCIHLLDSAGTIGVMTKRRYSSWVLHCTARRVAALELAAGLAPILAFCRSEANPADAPSRW